MKTTFLLALALLTGIPATAQAKGQSGKLKYVVSEDYYVDSVSVARPNAVSFELAGRGILMGLNYDYSMNESVALGIGLATYSWSSETVIRNVTRDIRVTFIPLYGNFYFQPNRHRAFLSGGVNLVHVSGKINSSYAELNGIRASDSAVIPTLGGGYEFRATSGFLFRASLYSFLNSGLPIWPGITLGGTF